MLNFLKKVAQKSKCSLYIRVAPPQKTTTSYRFEINIRDNEGNEKNLTLGIHSTNFDIPHHEFWDTFYPLMFITRNGGPVFGSDHLYVNVKFDYVASEEAIKFFENRANNFGFNLTVSAKLSQFHFDKQTKGDYLLFGGGKDSRLILGLLRELFIDPIVCSAKGRNYAQDIPNALVYETLNFAMPARIVPTLMLAPRTVYHGAGLGEVHESFPWHQYMDISTPHALAELSDLLASVGLNTKFETPVSILPYNLTQKILAQRYPNLHAHQMSVPAGSVGNKTLHVMLCHLYHNLSHHNIGDDDLLQKNIVSFQEKYDRLGDQMIGHRGNYEVILREITGIIHNLKIQGKLCIPNTPNFQQEQWIDFIHSYQNKELNSDFLRIYLQYADEISPEAYHSMPRGLQAIAYKQ